MSRPSRRGRCRHPLQDDDVVFPLQPRLVTAGFFWRGLWAPRAATRSGVTSKAPSGIAAASAWALAAASARAFAASSSCAALAAAALNASASHASRSSRTSRAFRSVAA